MATHTQINYNHPCRDTNYSKGRGTYGVSWITIHYTGAEGSALDNVIYFGRDKVQASAHYFVDDTGIYSSVAEVDTAWHCGNYHANQQSIGIEVCSNGEDFSNTEIMYLQDIVCDIMSRYGLDATHVVRHYDMCDVCNDGSTWVDPHKDCPHPYTPVGADPDGSKWRTLHRIICDRSVYTDGVEDTTTGEIVQDKSVTSYNLDIDGYWGRATTSALQDYLCTYVDGEIWGQYAPYVDAQPGLTSGWVCSDTPKGSICIRALQETLSRIGYKVQADGIMGKETARALQQSLGMSYIDGVFDGPSPAIKRMQQKLNERSLFK